MREFPFSFKFLFESFRFLLDKSSPPEDGSCFPVDTLLLIDDNGMFMVEFVFWVAPNSSLRSAELFLLMVLSMLVIRALFPIVCIILVLFDGLDLNAVIACTRGYNETYVRPLWPIELYLIFQCIFY